MINNKFLIKLITIFTLVMIMFTILGNKTKVYADTDPDTIVSKAKSFIEQGESKSTLNTSDIAKDLSGIGQLFYIIGLGVALIVGMILGLKYMQSGADQKANVKEKLIWYVIAIFLLVGAASITKMIITVAEGI